MTRALRDPIEEIVQLKRSLSRTQALIKNRLGNNPYTISETSVDLSINPLVMTTVQYDTLSDGDTHGYWIEATSQATIIRPGIYEAQAGIVWGVDDEGFRVIEIRKNTTPQAGNSANKIDNTLMPQSVSRILRFVAGDTFNVRVSQSSTNVVNILSDDRTYRSLRWLRA